MGKKLYVGNLPYTATDTSINALFSKHGSVSSVSIITDRDSGRSKGFGFVEFAEEQSAMNAMEDLNGSMLEGRALTVNEAKPQAPRDSRGGGSFGRRDRY